LRKKTAVKEIFDLRLLTWIYQLTDPPSFKPKCLMAKIFELKMIAIAGQGD